MGLLNFGWYRGAFFSFRKGYIREGGYGSDSADSPTVILQSLLVAAWEASFIIIV